MERGRKWTNIKEKYPLSDTEVFLRDVKEITPLIAQ